MYPWLTAKNVVAALKFAVIAAVLWQAFHMGAAFIADQKAQRTQLIEQSVGRTIAEAQNSQLLQVNADMQETARQQAAAFAASTQAIQALNGKFSEYRAAQQRTTATLPSAASVTADPAKAAADAQALSDAFGQQFEALYP